MKTFRLPEKKKSKNCGVLSSRFLLKGAQDIGTENPAPTSCLERVPGISQKWIPRQRTESKMLLRAYAQLTFPRSSTDYKKKLRLYLRVPWTARRPNQSILKEIRPECSLEGLMLKLTFQYFGHLIMVN